MSPGQVANPSQICSPSYWRDHIRKPVRFSEGIEALGALKCDAVVEIGPAPVLTALGQECLGRESTTWCASLRRGRDDWEQLLDCVMALHMVGVRIDWAGFDAGYARRKLDLPTYPFQRERYWLVRRRTLPRLPCAAVPPATRCSVADCIPRRKTVSTKRAFVPLHRPSLRIIGSSTVWCCQRLLISTCCLPPRETCTGPISFASTM